MNKIKRFNLRWKDAFDHYVNDYLSSVEMTEDEYIRIIVRAYTEFCEIELNDENIEEFISKIKDTGIQRLNGYLYSCRNMLDGCSWSIDILGDDLDVVADGSESFPYELEKLIEYLNEEWNLLIIDSIKDYYHKSLSDEERYDDRHILESDWRLKCGNYI